MANLPTDRERHQWKPGSKPKAMQDWAKLVMSDRRLSKGAIHVAWTLSFYFHDEQRRAWLGNELLCEETGYGESYLKACLAELDKCGHILRTKERRKGEVQRYIYPTLTRSNGQDAAKPHSRRKREAGTEGQAFVAEYGTEGQYPFGTEGPSSEVLRASTHILEEDSNHPGRVQDQTSAAANRQPDEKGFRREEIDSASHATVANYADDDDDGELPGAPRVGAQHAKPIHLTELDDDDDGDLPGPPRAMGSDEAARYLRASKGE